MRWDVTAQGAKQETRLGELHVTQDGEDRAEAHAILNAGPLRGRVECGWDYDGTMRVDLTLLPGDPRPLESLTLVISLKDQEATYFHAMGDGIRNTLSGRVPAGDGIVWSAKSVQASDMPHNFCTYVYVGTPVRGLCWFAENDRGWGWDPSTPNVEMVRKGDVLELRVHLVNQPLVVSQPRTLTFGLLAAPVKPRLTSDWRYEYRRDNYSLLGTDINWLALGDCGSVYPAGKDLFLWQMIKKGNEEHLTPAEIQSVVDRGKPYFAPYGDDVVQTFISHARFNTTSRFGTKMIFYYNRASYQAADEFETFKDEWDLSD
jgi:hypothetical protein